MDARQRLEELRGRKRLEELRAKKSGTTEAPETSLSGGVSALVRGAAGAQYPLPTEMVETLGSFPGVRLGEAAAKLFHPETRGMPYTSLADLDTQSHQRTEQNQASYPGVETTGHWMGVIAPFVGPVASEAKATSAAVREWLAARQAAKNVNVAKEFENVAGTITKSRNLEDLERIKDAAQRPVTGEASQLEKMATGEVPISDASEELTRKTMNMAAQREKDLGTRVGEFREKVETLPEQDVTDVEKMIEEAQAASEYDATKPTWEEKTAKGTKLKYDKKGEVAGTEPFQDKYEVQVEKPIKRASFSHKTLADLDTLSGLFEKGKINPKDALKAVDDMDTAIKWDSENPSLPQEVRSAYIEAREKLKGKLHGELEGYGAADKEYSDLITNMSTKLNKGQQPSTEEVEGARKYIFSLLDKDKKGVSRKWFEKTFGKEGQELLKQARDIKIAGEIRKGGDVPVNNPAYKAFKSDLYDKIMKKYQKVGAVGGGVVGALGVGESMGYGAGGIGALGGAYAGKYAVPAVLGGRAERLASETAEKMIKPSYLFDLARKAGASEKEATKAATGLKETQRLAKSEGMEAAQQYWASLPLSKAIRDLFTDEE